MNLMGFLLESRFAMPSSAGGGAIVEEMTNDTHEWIGFGAGSHGAIWRCVWWADNLC